jgi:ubiquitin-conjugating enzyme E2 C
MRIIIDMDIYSSSPLNGEAAILWDSNMEEFKRKVTARHVVPEMLEEQD